MLADFGSWLFASPRRLVVVGLSAVILIFVGGSALFGNDQPTGTGTGSTRSGAVAETDAAVPDSGVYVSTAVDFVSLWAQLEPGESTQEWQERLTPLATTDYARALATTDTDTLPGVPPEGTPVVRFLAQESAMIAVPLAGGSSVLVTVVTGDGTADPKVSDVQPNTGD